MLERLIALKIGSSVYRYTTGERDRSVVLTEEQSFSGAGTYVFTPHEVSLRTRREARGQASIVFSLGSPNYALLSLLKGQIDANVGIRMRWFQLEGADLVYRGEYEADSISLSVQVISFTMSAQTNIYDIWETGVIYDEKAFPTIVQ